MQLQKWKEASNPLPTGVIIPSHINVVCLRKTQWFILRSKVGLKWQNLQLESSIPNADSWKHLPSKYYNKNMTSIFLEYF